jgi:hypothetical protein
MEAASPLHKFDISFFFLTLRAFVPSCLRASLQKRIWTAD